MRHLLSVLLALILTPLIYISAGFSAIKFGEANDLGKIEIVPAALGLLAAFVAGGLYALLVMARLSPFGPVLAGLVYLGVTLWRLFDLEGFLGTVPADLFGVENLLHVPAGFGTALLAVPLLLTVFSPRRWRRTAQPAPATYQGAPAYNAPPGSAAPTYGAPATTPSYEPSVYPPSSAAPSYAPPTYQPPTYQPSNDEPPTYQPPSYPPPAGSEPPVASEPPAPPAAQTEPAGSEPPAATAADDNGDDPDKTRSW